MAVISTLSFAIPQIAEVNCNFNFICPTSSGFVSVVAVSDV